MESLNKPVDRRKVVMGLSSGTIAMLLGASRIRLTGAQATPAASPMAAASPVASTGPTASLSFGLIPAESSTTELSAFKPLTDYLKTDLQIVKFDISVGADYTAVIEAMKSNHLDLAEFGPFSYVLAAEVAGAKALIMPGQADGTPSTYHSLIITNPKSGITTLADLKGHSFAFVDPASTSGNLVPRGILIQNHIDPDKDLKGIFAGGHDAAILAVANGTTDAGCCDDAVLASMIAAGTVKKDDIVILTTSDPIPEGPIAYRAGLDPALVERVRESFINFTNVVTDQTVLAGIIEDGVKWVDSPDSLYDNLRALAKALNLTPDSL